MGVEAYYWIAEQIPQIIVRVLQGVRRAQEGGEAVEMPDYLSFSIDAGEIGVDFDIPMKRKPGENGKPVVTDATTTNVSTYTFPYQYKKVKEEDAVKE